MVSRPNVVEAGNPGNIRRTWNPTSGNTYESAPADHNPDLTFPRSVRVYDRMRRDGKIASLLKAVSLPLLGAAWDLNTDGVDPSVVQLVRSEIGLPEPNSSLPKRRTGVVWLDHLRESLMCLSMGFMPFEQVYLPENGVVHLRKLGPRQPRTISQIVVGADGGLVGIFQRPAGWDMPQRAGVYGDQYIVGSSRDDVFIPVDRLAMYVLDKEGGDWTGVSLLRSAYGDWISKDGLRRLLPQIIERNSMGVPVIYYDESTGTTKEDALQQASDFRAGATAGLALSGTSRAELLGGKADVAGVIDAMKYYDQAMSSSVLAMFMDLGHDTGARSLGETFLHVFNSSLQSIADTIAATATEHVVRDLVRWNFGADMEYPTLTAGNLASQSVISPEAIAALLTSGALTADPGLEEALRKQHGLPSLPAGTVRTPPMTDKPPAAPDPVGGGTAQQLAEYGAGLAARLSALADGQ